MKHFRLLLLSLALVIIPTAPTSAATPCAPAGSKFVKNSVTYVCTKVSGKLILVEQKIPVAPTAKPNGKISGPIVTPEQIVSKKTSNSCTALIPDGWRFNTSTGKPIAPVAEIFNDKKHYYGLWAMRGVNDMETPMWVASGWPEGLFSHDAQTSALATAFLALDANKNQGFANWGNDVKPVKTIGSANGYTVVEIKSTGSRGVMAYRDPSFPGDGWSTNVITSVRLVLADSSATDDDLLLLMRHTLSIQCNWSVQMSSDSLYQVKARTTSSKGRSQEPTDSEYNAQLGTTYTTKPDGSLVALNLDKWTNNACGKGEGGWSFVDANGCNVLK